MGEEMKTCITDCKYPLTGEKPCNCLKGGGGWDCTEFPKHCPEVCQDCIAKHTGPEKDTSENVEDKNMKTCILDCSYPLTGKDPCNCVKTGGELRCPEMCPEACRACHATYKESEKDTSETSGGLTSILKTAAKKAAHGWQICDDSCVYWKVKLENNYTRCSQCHHLPDYSKTPTENEYIRCSLCQYHPDYKGPINDPVNHPSHYTAGGIEVLDLIEAWGLGYHLGNVVKYVVRAGKKDPAKTLEDLKKAQFYLDRYIKTTGGSKDGMAI